MQTKLLFHPFFYACAPHKHTLIHFSLLSFPVLVQTMIVVVWLGAFFSLLKILHFFFSFLSKFTPGEWFGGCILLCFANDPFIFCTGVFTAAGVSFHFISICVFQFKEWNNKIILLCLCARTCICFFAIIRKLKQTAEKNRHRIFP